MEYQCFVCLNLFSDEKDAIKHLKNIHFIKENINPIYCLKKCKYYCLTFRQLKIHMKSCQFDDSAETQQTNQPCAEDNPADSPPSSEVINLILFYA